MMTGSSGGDAPRKLGAEAWDRIFEAADEVLDLPPEEREAFLVRWSIEHPALGAELRDLLARGERPSPLDSTAAIYGAPIFDGAAHAEEPAVSRTLFGPYRIVSEIGRGGMGAVYLAERSDDQYDKRVALKLLPAGNVADRRLVERFLEERQILAALDHPDIARLVDGGVTAEGIPWFALEFVDGIPIDRYCDEHRLSIEKRLELFCRICGAVQYAHRNLVVHCDLKPANILVTADGQVRLLDFGIARLLGEQVRSGHRTGGDRILTPLYASPEQIDGRTISAASDVYALGVLLYRILADGWPYRPETETPQAIARAVVEQDALAPSVALREMSGQGARSSAANAAAVAAARGMTPRQLQRRLEGDLDAIALRAVANDPSRRYETAQQLEGDVRRHLGDFPIIAGDRTRLHDARKFVRRHRLGVTAAAVIAMLVMAFSVATTIQASRIRAQAERITLERDRAEQVSRYLSALFTSTNPTTLRRGSTAREILDSAAASIQGPLFAEPAQRARLMFEMAQAYHQIGFPERARELLDGSLALRRSLDAPGDVELAATLHLLGTVHSGQGRMDSARAAFAEALAMRRGSLGRRHRDVARTLVGLAGAMRASGRLPEAERLAREAMAIDRDRPADLVQSTSALANVLLDGGDHDGAAQLFRSALALARETHPEEHAEVAAAIFGLAAALKGAGDRAGADSLISHGLALHQRLLASAAYSPGGEGPPGPGIGGAALADAGRSASHRVESAGSPSRDEPSIVFISDRESPDVTGNAGAPQIYVMAADGSGERRLTGESAPVSFPAWSPDGRLIAFGSMRGGEANIIVMAADGTNRRRLIDPARYGAGAMRPTWSPDGRRIAFQSVVRRDIHVVGIDGSGLANITNHPSLDMNPSWSPDGRRIAFVSDRDGNDEIYVMDADGTNVTRLTFDEHEDQRPSWSPDGRRIAFHSERTGDQEIWTMNADGSDPVRLTSHPDDDAHAVWSPDGLRILFHRRVFGHLQIHVMNADGSGIRRLTEPSGAAFSGFASWRGGPRR